MQSSPDQPIPATRTDDSNIKDLLDDPVLRWQRRHDLALDQGWQARQAWYQANSPKLSNALQQDMQTLRTHYLQLKKELQGKRADWQQLLSHVGSVPLQHL
jgi:hypothetical protein